ncbi:MAG: hypothetical protein ACK6BG_13610 [Cyanobacteriota bacterium]
MIEAGSSGSTTGAITPKASDGRPSHEPDLVILAMPARSLSPTPAGGVGLSGIQAPLPALRCFRMDPLPRPLPDRR